MAILLLSPDPDLRALLAFLLRFHELSLTVAEPLPPDGTAPPALLLVDLIDAAVAPVTAAIAAPYAATCPLLVLCHPGPGTEQAHMLLPTAAAYLPVPFFPRALVAQVRGLLQDDAAVGYGLVGASSS